MHEWHYMQVNRIDNAMNGTQALLLRLGGFPRHCYAVLVAQPLQLSNLSAAAAASSEPFVGLAEYALYSGIYTGEVLPIYRGHLTCLRAFKMHW